MKVRLLHPDRDVVVVPDDPAHAADLRRDLGLDALVSVMSEDSWQAHVIERILLEGVVDGDRIRYRQDVLRDCIDHRGAVAELHDIAQGALERKRHDFLGLLSKSAPARRMRRSIDVLSMYLGVLTELRDSCARNAHLFRSAGLTSLCARIDEDFDPAYLREIAGHLETLTFKSGELISARIGTGDQGTDYRLHRNHRAPLREFVPLVEHSSLTFEIDPRDIAGSEALGALRSRGIDSAARVLTASEDHVTDFLQALATELSFYLGAETVYRRLTALGCPVTFPVPADDGHRHHTNLIEPTLAVRSGARPVGNDLPDTDCALVFITGANQGGKTTYLRSLGIAQVMMQAGMFVAAEEFTAPPRTGVFTHFRREADPTMRHGGFDDELVRMRSIVEDLEPGGLLLCNESFSTTDFREGSIIGSSVVRALLDEAVSVIYVSHMYDLVHAFQDDPRTITLLAERLDDGTRTFRLRVGSPSASGYAEDVFARVFGTAP